MIFRFKKDPLSLRNKMLSKSYLQQEACELPLRLDTDPIEEPWFDDADPRSPLSPRSPRRPIPTTTCTAIIQSGAKRGQACGKPALENETLCKYHLQIQLKRPSPSDADQAPTPKRPKLVEPVPGRCICRTQKGFICGAVTQPNSDFCKRHAKCQPVDVEEKEEDSASIRAVEEPILYLPDTEPIQPVETQLLQQEAWTEHYVQDNTEMMRILNGLPARDLDEEQFRLLESKIRACFE